MSTRILVVYHSATGNTAKLVESLAAGAREAGARSAAAPPPEAIANNPRWQAQIDAGHVPNWRRWTTWTRGDGVAAGSPTRLGGPAAQLESYSDATGGWWPEGSSRTGW